ncbi:MAG TPA: 2-C-methyl-D-erythritol 2,4-cyclodiphosphate synthase [Candidatus Cloacimonadota bacterium]|nr:2-C-methyl-D-erythritol 2,4-cyclodiphosphate synthase [Candidatus Cloacimonadota bacterium]HQL15430.1 2-C-methyl-D-erythritol 2,4-cyclodiphosphate synthase [Candidatus Cloacimonadota bacterium]
MKIGFGYDVHRLKEGGKLILGGVEIPFPKGLEGHSNADVVIHAVIDSILGAMAWGDIGYWFPDTESAFRNIDSRILLKKVIKKVLASGFQIGNLDVTVCANEPKLAPYITQMRFNLATDLETDVNNISVKATTEEGLGVTGKGEGISAQAVVLLISLTD